MTGKNTPLLKIDPSYTVRRNNWSSSIYPWSHTVQNPVHIIRHPGVYPRSSRGAANARPVGHYAELDVSGGIIDGRGQLQGATAVAAARVAPQVATGTDLPGRHLGRWADYALAIRCGNYWNWDFAQFGTLVVWNLKSVVRKEVAMSELKAGWLRAQIFATTKVYATSGWQNSN